jgi:hypothetical protein
MHFPLASSLTVRPSYYLIDYRPRAPHLFLARPKRPAALGDDVGRAELLLLLRLCIVVLAAPSPGDRAAEVYLPREAGADGRH